MYLVGIVLAIVLVIPTAWFPFQLTKVAIFALCLLVAVVLFVLGRGGRDLVHAHGFSAALLIVLLPLSYAVSWYFSTNRAISLYGFSGETDTVLFVVLGFLAFILAFVLFRTLHTVRILLSVVFWAILASVVFQWASILFGPAAIPFHIFADRSANLVGKWNDFGLLVALLGLFVVARAELASMQNLRRVGLAVLGVVLAVLLGVINFSLAWSLVLGLCIVIALAKLIAQREGEWLGRTPWFALAGALCSIAFLFFGSAFNTRLSAFFPVSSLEVRPSYQSTLDVINQGRTGSLERVLVGTGPGTFGQVWLAHKPVAVNQSLFWNLDFNVGYSTFMTALGSVGLIGIIAWLVPLFLVIAGFVRAVRLSVLNREERIAATSLGVGVLLLNLSLLFYVPGPNIVLLAFVFSGAAFGFLWRQGQARVQDEGVVSRGQRLGVVASMLVLVLLSLWGGVASARRLVAEAYTNAGALALQQGSVDTAITLAARAQKIEATGNDLRLGIDTGAAKLQQLAASTSTPTKTLQEQFSAQLQATLTLGRQAITQNPQDYRTYLSLAGVYVFLDSLNVQGAYENASSTYQKAAALNPTNPTIPLYRARLAGAHNDVLSTQKYLVDSLTLKQDYTDAILFLVQLNVANKDLPSAIRAAQAAVQSAPGVASIWFELGLLYYSASDTKNALPVLEQALKLQPDYANAKYFLGLSYAAQSRVPDAIAQFQDLKKTNPDNTEVELILNNLLAGKPPFEGAQPPVTKTPQARPAAPISQ